MPAFRLSAFSVALGARLLPHRNSLSRAITAFCALGAPLAPHATDVTVQPSVGSGFVVKDASGANERLRVQESGAISLPSVASAPAQSQGLCMGTGGQLGPCSGGMGGTSYTAATGLTLTGTTFSVAPTYQLPQTCTASQLAQWNGTAWICGSATSAALPIGTVNQTLRYDTSNNLVANPLLQTFEDGGLVAKSSGYGPIPATGRGGRLMWYSGPSAFRAGYVDGTQWDQPNIGYASMAMGYNSVASGLYSIAIGDDASATKDYSAAIGHGSSAEDRYSVALGGGTAKGYVSTAIGGTSEGSWSVAIGERTRAIGQDSLAMGGNTVADGDYSTAMGWNVGTGGKRGSFIYGDASFFRTAIVNDAENQFMVVADGGVVLTTSADGSTGAKLNHGTGTWTSFSDRNGKTAVRPVNPREVLKKVAELPMNTWQYKAQEAKYRHMGPMAQDFYAAFHLGESDKGIDTIDADGVALAAIQGLHAELTEKNREVAALREDKDREVATLRAELAAQKEEIAQQRNRMAALESATRDLDEMKAQLAALRASTSKVVTAALKP